MLPIPTLGKEFALHPIKAVSLGTKYVLAKTEPFYASFDTTNSCNLRCQGCDFPLLFQHNKLGKDPSLATLEQRLEKLHAAFGSMLIVFAGFEPTARKDLPQLIAAADEHHYPGTVTNGTLFTDESAREAWDAGMKFVSVSIPTLNEKRFLEIIGADKNPRLQRFGVERVKRTLDILLETAPPTKLVTITTTFDNKTTPEDIRRLATYAQSVGVLLSLQPYSPTKPASAHSGYDPQFDERRITRETIETLWGGSISQTVLEIQKQFPVIIGRRSAILNFDRFVKEGYVEFKPRALKVTIEGDVMLYPEGPAFTNIDKQTAYDLRTDFKNFVELQKPKGFYAPNCYRCVNLTSTSNLIEMAQSVFSAFARKNTGST